MELHDRIGTNSRGIIDKPVTPDGTLSRPRDLTEIRDKDLSVFPRASQAAGSNSQRGFHPVHLCENHYKLLAEHAHCLSRRRERGGNRRTRFKALIKSNTYGSFKTDEE